MNSRSALLLSFIALVALVATGPAMAGQPAFESVVGPTQCNECHKVEAKIWEGTHHFKTFTELPRREEATTIASKMGMKRIKSGSLCLDCHFLTADVEGKRKAIGGISCESCHGGAKQYLDRHSKFSGHENAEQESAEEAAKRWADSEAGGMIRPGNLYRLAKNCYGCHVVPEETLVNVGGHAAGSPFELVSWSQGEIRHNTWHNQNSENRLADASRRRMMYVVGTAVELETALAATGKATQKATYGVTMAKRADAARKRMAKIAAAVSAPEIEEITTIAAGVALKLNNEAELSAAAKSIGEAAARLAANHDGSAFAGVDSLIPGPDKVKGKPVAVAGSAN